MAQTLYNSLLTTDRLKKVEAGLKSILRHFEEPITPRTIAFGDRFGIVVDNIADIMYHYEKGKGIDCRINAYPDYTDSYINRGTGITPSQLLVDIDRKYFESDEEFELAGKNTYSNFEKLGIEPTWMWTGGGYHFLLPQSVPILEKIDDFKEFSQPSRKFLQFEEQLLTNNNADQSHSSTVSFKNMYMRIPGSVNSKYIQFNEDKSKIINIPYEAEVRVIKPWNGVRYNVGSSLLTQYYIWSQAEAVNDIEDKIRRARLYDGKHKNCRYRWPNKIDWIERLLNKPLDDFRECCVVFILVPYLMNIRKLSRLETYNIVKKWLDRCNSLDPLRFDADYKINYTIDRVGEILPQSRDNLKSKRNRLYMRLLKEDVIV